MGVFHELAVAIFIVSLAVAVCVQVKRKKSYGLEYIIYSNRESSVLLGKKVDTRRIILRNTFCMFCLLKKTLDFHEHE